MFLRRRINTATDPTMQPINSISDEILAQILNTNTVQVLAGFTHPNTSHLWWSRQQQLAITPSFLLETETTTLRCMMSIRRLRQVAAPPSTET